MVLQKYVDSMLYQYDIKKSILKISLREKLIILYLFRRKIKKGSISVIFSGDDRCRLLFLINSN